MITNSFKVWGAYAFVAYVAAVIYGFSSGGDGVGPLSLGYLGGVGDHAGYAILIGLCLSCLVIGIMLQAFRDADPDMAANYLDSGSVPATQPPVGASLWPIATGLGMGTVILGLAVHPAVFAAGMAILGIIAIEWAMEAWADRATGDRTANRELRDRIMGPVELPLMAAIGVALVAISISRVLLTVSKVGSVVVASVAALLIFGTAIFLAIGPELNKKIVNSILAVGLVGVVAAGIVSAANGVREIEHHGPHGDDHGGEEDHNDEESFVIRGLGA